jgi:hypothetical protein
VIKEVEKPIEKLVIKEVPVPVERVVENVIIQEVPVERIVVKEIPVPIERVVVKDVQVCIVYVNFFCFHFWNRAAANSDEESRKGGGGIYSQAREGV